MANTTTRYVSYNGASSATFGMTVQDKGASTGLPNMTQLTMVPVGTGGTLQTYRFILAAESTTSVSSLYVQPNLSFTATSATTRLYQIFANISISADAGSGSILMGHYTLATVCKVSSTGIPTLIGSGAFKVETSLKDSGMEAYVGDTSISVTLTNSSSQYYPRITVTFNTNPTACDMLADITINSTNIVAS